MISGGAKLSGYDADRFQRESGIIIVKLEELEKALRIEKDL